MEGEFSVNGIVTSVAVSNEYFFFGLTENRVLVYDPETFAVIHTLTTKRPPVSMAVVDKRILVCGLKNHAFTAINFKDGFK